VGCDIVLMGWAGGGRGREGSKSMFLLGSLTFEDEGTAFIRPFRKPQVSATFQKTCVLQLYQIDALDLRFSKLEVF